MKIERRLPHNLGATALLAALTLWYACDGGKQESSEVARKENHEAFATREQRKEADFISDAIAEHYASVRFAQLAIRKSVNSDIRNLAAIIETDQGGDLKQFTAFANKKGISIPTGETGTAKDKIVDLNGQEQQVFDERWCGYLVKKSERDIQSFEAMWEETSDEELKDLINESLPEMRTHLVKLRSAQEKLAMN